MNTSLITTGTACALMQDRVTWLEEPGCVFVQQKPEQTCGRLVERASVTYLGPSFMQRGSGYIYIIPPVCLFFLVMGVSIDMEVVSSMSIED